MANDCDCDLYPKCLKVSTGFELFAKEATQTKSKIEEIAKQEEIAAQHREETSKQVNSIDKKLDKHMQDFGTYAEMQIKIDLNQRWMKIIGYSGLALYGAALLWLFTFANNTDKQSSSTETDVKYVKESVDEIKHSMKELTTFIYESKAENQKQNDEIDKLNNYTNRNYGYIKGLEAKEE